MTEPRNVTRWDPVEYCDQGSKGRGMMERDTDGDYVGYEDFRDLEIETQELVAALRNAFGWLEKGGVRSAHSALATALARNRAKQEATQ